MDLTLAPGARRGVVAAPPSKSRAQRLLLCAALGTETTSVENAGDARDVLAMRDCLCALGAVMERTERGALRVTPLSGRPAAERALCCGESAAVLRFLLPLCGALGAPATFHREGRLPSRPLAPLDALLTAHGMKIRENKERLSCEGELLAGNYTISGGVSSQFVSGLLFALPLLRGESTLTVEGALVSSPYVALSEQALQCAQIRFTKEGNRYTIPGGQRFAPPKTQRVEGDWSGAAAFLCMGALSARGVTVEGLDPDSVQGDRAILTLLRRFGAAAETSHDAVTVRRGALRGIDWDASQTPDLVPVVAALAALAEGETHITGAARLRDKESDRLRSAAALLRALGADVSETAEGLVIRGKRALAGGTADAANDHRVAMAAAVAACGCENPVALRGAECVGKSYPRFWEDVSWLCM